MRKFFYGLGIVFAILIVVALIGGVLVGLKGAALDRESKAFVDSSVPAISMAWDEQQLIQRASPALLSSLKPGDLSATFDKLSQLGSFVKYDGANGQANIANWNGVTTISAAYVAKAKFQKGDATFRIVLTKQDGKWMINGFHVDLSGASNASPTSRT